MSEACDFHGLPAIRWRSRDGATAVATLQGAHLVSWIPAAGSECLYVSERSPFEAGRAIRGGVPVCFPQFADRGPLPQHGFARNLAWKFDGVRDTQDDASAVFVLESSRETAAWPHPFRLQLVATVGGARLALTLQVHNPGHDGFTFTAALHTYLRIDAVEPARLEGLSGLRYVNRGSPDLATETRAAIPARDPIDRVYFAAPRTTTLRDAGRTRHIEQRGFTDTVVWNPGPERTATMVDMPADGWRHMLCVEAAAIEPPVALLPGALWEGTQSVTVFA